MEVDKKNNHLENIHYDAFISYKHGTLDDKVVNIYMENIDSKLRIEITNRFKQSMKKVKKRRNKYRINIIKFK